MRRYLGSVVVLAIAGALAGCGGSTKTVTQAPATTTGAPAASAGPPAACGQTERALGAFQVDLGMISKPSAGQPVYDRASADLDSLSTSLTLLKGQAKDTTQQTELASGITLIGRLQTSVRSMAAGDYSTAVGELTGDSPGYGDLLKLVFTTVCA